MEAMKATRKSMKGSQLLSDIIWYRTTYSDGSPNLTGKSLDLMGRVQESHCKMCPNQEVLFVGVFFTRRHSAKIDSFLQHFFEDY
jgi:hypothetical protein